MTGDVGPKQSVGQPILIAGESGEHIRGASRVGRSKRRLELLRQVTRRPG